MNGNRIVTTTVISVGAQVKGGRGMVRLSQFYFEVDHARKLIMVSPKAL